MAKKRCISYTMQCATIMALISPYDYTLQCGMWRCNMTLPPYWHSIMLSISTTSLQCKGVNPYESLGVCSFLSNPLRSLPLSRSE